MRIIYKIVQFDTMPILPVTGRALFDSEYASYKSPETFTNGLTVT
jgi:hypothetical protein